MKSVCLLCLITFVSCILAFSEASEDQFPLCGAQSKNISRAIERCLNANGGTPLDILEGITPIVEQYTDTDTDFSALDAFLEINCPRIPNSVQCLQYSLEPISECPPLSEYRLSKVETQKIILTGTESASRYFCANNGEVIKKLIPNEGAKFILSNDEFSRCTVDIFTLSHISQLCPLFNTAIECIKGIGADQPNTYLKIVGQHFIDEWKAIGNC